MSEPGQADQVPKRIRCHQPHENRANRLEGLGFKQISRNPGDKNKQKGDGGEAKYRSGAMGRKNPLQEKQDCNQQRSGVAKITRARPEQKNQQR